WLFTLCLFAPLASGAQVLDKRSIRHGDVDVPIEIARPAGPGPWPAVPYIPAKRGFEGGDREHMRGLARDGIRVVGPGGLSGNRHGDVDVPIEIARPAAPGPWPAVLYIHAKRGFEDVDREHMRGLARDGFLVVAPDWLSGNMLERWPDRHYPETEADVEAGLD